MSMEKTIKRAFELSTVDQTPNDMRFWHMIEELGEIAKAHRQEIGLKKGTPDEPSAHECIDTIITAIDMFRVQGGKFEEFEKVMNKKLDKYEKQMKEKGWMK